MRKTAWLLALVVGAVSFLTPRPAHAAVNVSVSFFYDELSPYGRWSEVGRYGHCWIPERVAVGWQPYTDGQWVYTEYGWTWVSYDPWGGDPYHYGTWAFEDPFGWVWVPGTVWAPAWVTWCYSDSYVGWAPIPPSLAFSYSGYSGPAVIVSQTQYVFVPVNRFAGVSVTTARLPVQQNATLLQQTQKVTSFSVSNGVVVNRGPSVQRIESAAHMKIPRASISAAKTSPTPISAAGLGRGKQLSVVTPAPLRAEAFKGKGKAATGAGQAPEKGKALETRHGTGPHEKGAKPDRGSRHEIEPPPPSGRESGMKRHQTPPPHHEAPPPTYSETPPAHHEAPQAHHEAPPPHHEALPPVKRKTPPPHHEPPPPPPPSEHVDTHPSPSAHAAPARPATVPSKAKEKPSKKDEGNPHGA